MRPPTTIADVLREPIENQGVQLRGKLLQQLSVTKYLFTDGKQQIRVQITPELFPKVAVDERTEIMIVGRVESEFMQSPEIDVSSVELLGPPAPMAPDAVMPFTP